MTWTPALIQYSYSMAIFHQCGFLRGKASGQKDSKHTSAKRL